ncbi:discoidin domain-containing protein [Segetibacter koreensis]|uniref:discoidin domain-containing protein n=1 Tax=Segetibacter koreensis TaxID=398037 RepID=UPI000A0237CC|nr:discoidin domain-containing protein [Segetibacter koreensis]
MKNSVMHLLPGQDVKGFFNQAKGKKKNGLLRHKINFSSDKILINNNKKGYFFLLSLLVTITVFSQNKTYYISSTGNDYNNGLSVSSPWKTVSKVSSYNFKPGDKVFFNGGQSFTGNLKFQSGDGPLTVASYGAGKAIIHANTGNGIYAYNTAGIEIHNLIVEGNGVVNDTSSGISFYMNQSADLNNIVIDSCEMYGFGGFGIKLGAWSTSNGYNNVRITNSSTHDNGQAGIFTYGYGDMYNHTNFYFAYNKTYNNRGRTDITYTHTGNGMVLSGVDGFTIEHCEAYGNGMNNRNKGGGPVGIWCYNAKNGIIQYSESHHNKAGLQADGGGFDIDGGSQNCVVQYNYSHDNEGPGYAFFEYGSSNQFLNDTIRYNISENDGLKNGYGGLAFWANDSKNKISKSVVYNNVFYAGNSLMGSAIDIMNTNISDVKVFNNIFYCINVPMLKGNPETITWQNNDYYSTGTTNFTTGGTTADPGFISPGSGIKGYKLSPNSPMIDAGLPHNTVKDFYSNSVSRGVSADIGIYESPEPNIASVIASDDDGNVPINTIDADVNTRWSAFGNNQWIKYNLDTTTFIDTIEIAWYRGNERKASFDIQTSINNNDWITVFSGTSSGQTTKTENYGIPPQYAKYIRIVGHGNTQNAWNAITEVEIQKSFESSPSETLQAARAVNSLKPSGLRLLPGLTETNNNFNIDIYPNPAIESFSIKTDRNWIGAALLITDISGKVVQKRAVEKPATLINLAGNAKGIYLLQVSKNGKIANRKIILQ